MKAKRDGLRQLPLCICAILVGAALAREAEAGEKSRAADAAGKGAVKVFILAGQSNMEGKGRFAELPAELKRVPKNVTFCMGDRKTGGKKTDFAASRTFGPEVAFSHEMSKAFPKDRIIVVKHAKGGTSVLEWLGVGCPSGKKVGKRRLTLYPTLMKAVSAATKGQTVRYSAVLWEQGGRDARFPKAAPDYAKNLKKLIERFRKDTKTPKLAFVYGEIGTPPLKFFPATETVRTCQRQVAKEVANVKLISTKKVSTKSDNTHFDTKGQIELGKRYAAAYLEMIKKAKQSGK